VITLAAPGSKKTGTVDISLDLGATGANLPWLRSLDNACGANTVCDPKARASFGVYAPETQKTVNIRDAF
jgi:MSHA biogenesis protein MshQ